MPKRLIRKIVSEYESKGVSPKKAASIAYGTMNNRGYMLGPNETPKGAAVERQIERDEPTPRMPKPRMPKASKYETETTGYDWRQRHGLKRGR